MSRRARRPSFSPTDIPAMLRALGEARDWAVKYKTALGFHDQRRQAPESVQQTIDAFAKDLTGDETYFHEKPHGGPQGQPGL